MQSMKTPPANVLEIKKMSGVGFEPTPTKCRLRPERSALDRSAILTHHNPIVLYSLIYND